MKFSNKQKKAGLRVPYTFSGQTDYQHFFLTNLQISSNPSEVTNPKWP